MHSVNRLAYTICFKGAISILRYYNKVLLSLRGRDGVEGGAHENTSYPGGAAHQLHVGPVEAAEVAQEELLKAVVVLDLTARHITFTPRAVTGHNHQRHVAKSTQIIMYIYMYVRVNTESTSVPTKRCMHHPFIPEHGDRGSGRECTKSRAEQSKHARLKKKEARAATHYIGRGGSPAPAWSENAPAKLPTQKQQGGPRGKKLAIYP